MATKKKPAVESLQGGFTTELKKHALSAIAGALVALVSMILVARFSSGWYAVQDFFQRDGANVSFQPPQYIVVDQSERFDPVIHPISSKVMHALLTVKLITNNVRLTPAIMTFDLAGITRPTRLSEILRGDAPLLEAIQEGDPVAVIELDVTSGNRSLDSHVAAFPVHSLYRGKWNFKLAGLEDGVMDVWQSGSDVFGTYNIDGGGSGSFVGRIDSGYFDVAFTDRKTLRHWTVNAVVEPAGHSLRLGTDGRPNAKMYAARDGGWIPDRDTTFVATKSD
ncbi:MAG TPA: hypothetical protein VNN08_00295 [Thermoanaerobaculia bacterium]|nr:hypothetical protein [Thermoanaerobaculia bacterium]